MSKAIAMGDDEGAISALTARLEVRLSWLWPLSLWGGPVGKQRFPRSGQVEGCLFGDAPKRRCWRLAHDHQWPAWQAFRTQ